MKSIDACKWFTPYINDAIREGYAPAMSTICGGSDGCQIWQRGRNYITMWVDESPSMDIDGIRSVRTLTLSVARFTLPKGTNFANSRLRWSDKWAEHVVASKKLYNVDTLCRDAWWTDDLDDVRRARDIHYSRLESRREYAYWVERPLTDELLAIVRKVSGFKRVDSRYIKVDKLSNRNAWCFRNTKSDRYVVFDCRDARRYDD